MTRRFWIFNFAPHSRDALTRGFLMKEGRARKGRLDIGDWLLGIGERIAHAKDAKVGKESRYANVRNPDRVGAGFECGFEFCVATLADLA